MIITDSGQMIDQNIKSDFPIIIRRREYHEHGPILKKHWHKEFMIFYIEKGTALIHCNSQPIPVNAGDLVIINPNDIHYVENCCSHLIESYIIIDLVFLLSYKEDVCQTKYIAPLLENHICFQNKIENDEDLVHQVTNLIAEYEQKKLGYELVIKAEVYRILVSLMRRHTVLVTDEVKNRQHPQLRPLLEYIDEHYQQKITLKKLAALANVSPYHLCRLFKSIIGMPPIEYINHLRISEAKKLLEQHHHLKVGEVAQIVGFNDSNYFSRLFKKYNHISPINMQKDRHKL
ncbi:MAG TPA: AraC family transcriptional regulator [Methylomusa anaerophila]|uniref:HTH-type transcriptional activator Btr n=1 Tax=Methylomusa anaerophila TaxID=1930071 RepID=A0A348AI45_9FIRM|nr:AraC family transcriptional regulator [Methylomusa anaerophila]BBB90743.1 HTH-type transcriptional activator Btr [Methylomusa anaerophila]HML88654.1 AraC family transcriptional regulator [Methylomusa anaerophila]